MLCFDGRVAEEVGVNCAVVIQQLNYWTSKGFGKEINGKKYIYNTYEQWQKQFLFMSVMTIRRCFAKLVDLEIVFTYRKGYDRTSHWSLNYSHPICSYCTNGSVQNEQMDKVNLNSSIGTYINQRQQTKPTASKLKRTKLPTTKTKHTTSKYREQFKDANEWLESQTSDFQKEVTSYLEYHCNTPKVRYPHALRMKIIVEVWKKYNGLTSQTDFDYINKEDLKPSKREEIIANRKDFSGGLEEEMESLYLRGEVE
jgi:hypothetical protein